ncbi:MAG: hypothetical protein J6Y91_01825 [Alphaproteobacteria bacterium]|nr:hypothetical protein [Alphaproteobacteria bacterium]
MSFIKEVKDVSVTIFQDSKNIAAALKEKDWKGALKATGGLLKDVYVNHIKGKTIEIGEKKIPLIAIIILVLLALFSTSLPFLAKTATEPVVEQVADSDLNYDQNGIRIYGLEKCEEAVCGHLENYGQQPMAEVVIAVTFYADDDIPVCNSKAVANNLAPTVKADFVVPCTIDFATFKLTDVTVQPF